MIIMVYKHLDSNNLLSTHLLKVIKLISEISDNPLDMISLEVNQSRDHSILSIYRDPQGCDIVATLSVAMISQSLRVAISFNSATKILSFFVLFCDICQYRNKISDFFEHFLRYGKYRKKGQKGAKIFVALLSHD